MAQYFQDPNFLDFYWVTSTTAELRNQNAPFRCVDLLQDRHFLIQNFRPNAASDVAFKIFPIWVVSFRDEWMDYMQSKSRSIKKPKKLKLNPAIIVLQKLSGFDEKKLRKIFDFGDCF